MPRLRVLHAWTGVFVALALAAIGVTGAMTALRAEIIAASLPQARAPAPRPQTLGAALDRFETLHPGDLVSVKFSPYGLGVHRAYLKAGGGAYLGEDGRMLAQWRGASRVEDAVFTFHHTLFAGAAGERIAGILALVGLCLSVVGVVIWWPTRRLFSWRLAPSSLDKRALQSAHRNLGVVVAIFLLPQFATGAALAFETPLRKAFAAAAPTPPKANVQSRNWGVVLEAAAEAWPEAKVRRIFAPRKANAPFVVFVQAPGEVNPEGVSRVFVDGDGAVLGVYDATKASLSAQALNSLLALHSASIGGAVLRFGFALGGLGLSALAILGAISFLRRAPMKRRSKRA